jgi:hypothetical protein
MRIAEKLEMSRQEYADAQSQLEVCEQTCRNGVGISDDMLSKRERLRARVTDLPQLIQRLERSAEAERMGEALSRHRVAISNAAELLNDLVSSAENELTPVVARLREDLQNYSAELATLDLNLLPQFHEVMGALLGLHGCRSFAAIEAEIETAARRKLAELTSSRAPAPAGLIDVRHRAKGALMRIEAGMYDPHVYELLA